MQLVKFGVLSVYLFIEIGFIIVMPLTSFHKAWVAKDTTHREKSNPIQSGGGELLVFKSADWDLV